MGECEAPLQKRGTAFQMTELGQAIFTPGVILEMILAESGRSSAGGARGSLRAYAQDDCVLPSTHFPNLTDLREALVTETAQAGASVEGVPRGCRALRGPAHRDAQRNVAARRRSNHDQARALASSRIWGE